VKELKDADKKAGVVRSVPLWVCTESKSRSRLQLPLKQLQTDFCSAWTIDAPALVAVADFRCFTRQQTQPTLSEFLQQPTSTFVGNCLVLIRTLVPPKSGGWRLERVALYRGFPILKQSGNSAERLMFAKWWWHYIGTDLTSCLVIKLQ
jgi:hypothetical protein